MLLSLLLRNKLLYFYEYGMNIIYVRYIYILMQASGTVFGVSGTADV